MAYEELEPVLSPWRESLVGGVSRGMAAGALGVGVVGAAIAPTTGLNPYIGFFAGLVLGLALVWPVAGVALVVRALLLAMYAMRGAHAMHLGAVHARDVSTTTIKSKRGDRVVVVIRGGK